MLKLLHSCTLARLWLFLDAGCVWLQRAEVIPGADGTGYVVANVAIAGVENLPESNHTSVTTTRFPSRRGRGACWLTNARRVLCHVFLTTINATIATLKTSSLLHRFLDCDVRRHVTARLDAWRGAQLALLCRRFTHALPSNRSGIQLLRALIAVNHRPSTSKSRQPSATTSNALPLPPGQRREGSDDGCVCSASAAAAASKGDRQRPEVRSQPAPHSSLALCTASITAAAPLCLRLWPCSL